MASVPTLPAKSNADSRAAFPDVRLPAAWRETLQTATPFALVDAAMVAGSAFVCSWLFAWFGAVEDWDRVLVVGLPCAVFLSFLTTGLYPGTALGTIVEIRRIVMASFVAVSVFAVGSFDSSAGIADRVPTVLTLLLIWATVPFGRIAVRRVFTRTSWWGRHAVIVGSSAKIDEVLRSEKRLLSQGIRLVPFRVTEVGPSVWSEIARVDPSLLILCPDGPWEKILARREASRFRDVLVLAPEVGGVFGRTRLQPAQLGLSTAFEIKNRLLFMRYAILKRGLDLLICGILLPVLFPVFLGIALLVKISSSGPVFFGHRRIGRNGEWIRVWKFRTMVADASKVLTEHLEAHPAAAEEWERTHKLRDDPRTTRIGQFLRETSLDELPQLWSVFVGTMSLVGPRPIVSEEIEKYGEAFQLYKDVTPGITGLWQVSGRNNTTYPERVALDAAYVRNWSILLDLYILARTFRTVVRREGAC